MYREFFVLHSWQNGTDGVNVLWCHSHLVWLVFEGFIPTCACFHLENVFVTCSCCFFLLFRNSKRKGEDTWSVKYESINCVVHKDDEVHAWI